VKVTMWMSPFQHGLISFLLPSGFTSVGFHHSTLRPSSKLLRKHFPWRQPPGKRIFKPLTLYF